PEDVKDKETEFNKSESLPVDSMLLFEGIKNGIAKIFRKKKNTTFQEQKQSISPKTFNKLFLIIPVILLVIIGIIVLYITSLGAVITVTITPKTLEEKHVITFDTSGSNDFGKDIIAAQEIQTQES